VLENCTVAAVARKNVTLCLFNWFSRIRLLLRMVASRYVQKNYAGSERLTVGGGLAVMATSSVQGSPGRTLVSRNSRVNSGGV